jgi:hypothetical protein
VMTRKLEVRSFSIKLTENAHHADLLRPNITMATTVTIIS